MRNSCIPHPECEELLVIRRWQIEATDGNHCAAALLSFFEYWHNHKLDEMSRKKDLMELAAKYGEEVEIDTVPLQFHTEEQLETGLLGLYKRKTIRSAIALLVELGFVSVHRNPNPKYSFDNKKYFLLETDKVKDWLSYRKPKTAQSLAKSRSRSQGKITSPSGKNAGTITEITQSNLKYSNQVSKNGKKASAVIGFSLGENPVVEEESLILADAAVGGSALERTTVSKPDGEDQERKRLVRGLKKALGDIPPAKNIQSYIERATNDQLLTALKAMEGSECTNRPAYLVGVFKRLLDGSSPHWENEVLPHLSEFPDFEDIEIARCYQSQVAFDPRKVRNIETLRWQLKNSGFKHSTSLDDFYNYTEVIREWWVDPRTADRIMFMFDPKKPNKVIQAYGTGG